MDTVASVAYAFLAVFVASGWAVFFGGLTYLIVGLRNRQKARIANMPRRAPSEGELYHPGD